MTVRKPKPPTPRERDKIVDALHHGKYALVGRGEAAEITGIAKSNLTATKGFPKAVLHLGNGQLWLRSEIEAFARDFKERHPA